MPTAYPEALGFRSFARANAAASLDEQRALVAGGTQGIGAGIALRYALAGAEVWLIGRSRERGDAVVQKLQQASQEYQRRSGKAAHTSGAKEHVFFSADLADAREITRVVEEVRQKAGEKGIDWIVQTQGGLSCACRDTGSSSR
jgi:NAD(P)-dependent dehydrogenase (short-subunit alcohol dehydrogenase family)